MPLFHDPKREVSKLHEQLASYDKPIAFLFGAGSSAIHGTDGLPIVPPLRPLTARCEAAVAALEPAYSAAYRDVLDTLRPAGLEQNIEEIVSAIHRRIEALGAAENISGATRPVLEVVEATVRRTIAVAAMPEDARIPADLPHDAFARWISRVDRTVPVEVFTTNYDTLFERALEKRRVPLFDGFVGSRRPFFLPGTLSQEDMAPGKRWTRIWKIHGSVNWQAETGPGNSRRVVRGEETALGELILPSYQKYEESRKQPYLAILDRLARVLTGREDVLLITSGYNFGDQHINQVLIDAMEARPRLHVIALQHSDPTYESELRRIADQCSNIIVYAPTIGVLAGQVAGWRLAEPVDASTTGLMDIAFDSDAVPDPAVRALTGRMCLGDFNKLGRFLDWVSEGA